MSEYWVSKKKYFCKYCDIYITDDAPSRRQHETGLRHQGNRERFIRGLYKEGEKRKRDLEEEKREMVRVELAAQAAYAQDISSGRAKASSSAIASSSKAITAPTPAQKPSNPFTNYSTAASLGFEDPDAERIAAEAERRRTTGTVGAWEVVTPTGSPSVKLQDAEGLGEDATSLKRPADSAVDEEDSRQFKLRKKTLEVRHFGQVYNPDSIPIKLKPKKEEEPDVKLETAEPTPPPPASAAASLSPVDPSIPQPTPLKKWTKLEWKKPGEQSKSASPPASQGNEALANDAAVKPEPQVKQEEAASSDDLKPIVELPSVKIEPDTAAKVEESASTPPPAAAVPASGGLFRKRKGPNRGT